MNVLIYLLIALGFGLVLWMILKPKSLSNGYPVNRDQIADMGEPEDYG